MASAIAMAGDHVRIAQNGMVMIHNPWNVAVGDAEDLRKAAEVLDKFGTSLVGIYAQKTGLDEAEIRSMMDEETWLNADEALARGFVDEIIAPVEASAFAELDISELGSAPEQLVALIREGRQVAKTKSTPAPAAAPTPAANPPAEPERRRRRRHRERGGRSGHRGGAEAHCRDPRARRAPSARRRLDRRSAFRRTDGRAGP